MTRDEIIRMAREAGFANVRGGLMDNGELSDYWDCWPNQLERFAALVAAAEREAYKMKQDTNGATMSNIITIDGVEYAPVNPVATGTRAVVVVDRGWIFAGDVTRENGRIRISRALHVFAWHSIGFAKMVETQKADLRPISDVDMPEGAEIFCVPVSDDWGL